jgi:predicted Zn-dependent protease
MAGLVSAWRNWQERREILKEARKIQADNHEWNRFTVRDQLTDALAALALNDERKATAIWESVSTQYPREAAAAPLAVDVLVKLRRFDEAEALMLLGLKKSPREIFFHKALALIARTRGDLPSAIDRYAALRRQFPGVWEGYVLGAQALAAAKRLEEADTLAERAMKMFPEEIGGFLEYGRLAEIRSDWTETLKRWSFIQERFPHWAFGYLGSARALIELARFDEAEAILTEMRVRFPTDSSRYALLAQCAEARGDIPESVKRWHVRVERFPMESYGYSNAAEALERMGQVAEAEAILRAGIDRFPTDPTHMIALAAMFGRLGAHGKAAEAWATLRDAMPDYEEAYRRGADALRRAGQSEHADALTEEIRRRFESKQP